MHNTCIFYFYFLPWYTVLYCIAIVYCTPLNNVLYCILLYNVWCSIVYIININKTNSWQIKSYSVKLLTLSSRKRKQWKHETGNGVYLQQACNLITFNVMSVRWLLSLPRKTQNLVIIWCYIFLKTYSIKLFI